MNVFCIHAANQRSRSFGFSRVLLAFGLAFSTGTISAQKETQPIPPLYRQGDAFEEAIAEERIPPPKGRQVTGITVPHHLLAPELIARGFYHASGGNYDRILLLSPDHFRKCQEPFATTDRSFQSVLGTIAPDTQAIKDLCERCDLIEHSELFAEEHGIQAILPFIAHFFPDAKLIPLVIRTDSNQENWRELVEALKPLLTDRTLIVQSTDFSHYLPGAVANRRDQETMNVLASGSSEDLIRLMQPDHLDALAAQWIHLALQTEALGARCTIIAHSNSDSYTASPQRETTSYLVQVFEKHASEKPPWPIQDGEARYYFAGDTFFGRNMAHRVSNPQFAAEVNRKIHRLTGGAPLLLNLEGVLSANVPAEGDQNLLLMPDDLTLKWLKKLNVVGVSLANNHAHDRGLNGWRSMQRKLEKSRIVVVGDHETHDFGPFRLAAFTDLSNQLAPYTQRLNQKGILSSLEGEQQKPLFCFLHWGREWNGEPGEREEQLTKHLLVGGASVILGAHPHTTSKGIEALRGGRCARAYSMGNFLFDQRSPKASGAMVEARFFHSGNYALRWIPLENFFETKLP